MGATLTTVNAIMKEVYEGEINDQLQEERVTIKRIERTSDNVMDNIGGKYVVFPVRKGRNHGISYRGENSQLAAAGQQAYKAAQETLRYGYQRVRITGQTMKLAETKPQAFASAMERETQGAKEDVLKDENYVVWGHPDQRSQAVTGIRAKLTSSPSSSTTFTVDTTDWIEEGMIIDIVNPSGPTVSVTGATVTVVNHSTLTITVGSAISSTSGYYVCRTGNYDLEPYGFSNIISDSGALHGLNPATTGEGFWASQEDNSTNTLTELKMISLCDTIRKRGGGNVSAIFCSLGVRRSYFNLMTGLRRYPQPKEFAGGLVGLSFMYGSSDIPVVEDPDAPASTMAFVDESEIKVFRDQDWYWEDIDGSVWKWVSDYDAFEALLKQYWQIGTHKRSAHGVMTAITES